ncbi:MAG: aminotransferase [Bacteroidetes bacterium HGW-Bacteroidetes-12]|nr:MAG: aminotransferase [Bacteroidetes bacterium HGW-Bacteroidetes-12]
MTEENKSNIYVTQPFLPDLKEFIPYLEQIWKNKILTNNGPFHQQLEDELCKYLGVKYISLFSNGTLALITALQALKITGEVITTPFSFVATTHALWWNNIKPVFVDIEPNTFTLDPDKIEAAITPSTTAILPVHVYGNPCYVDEIEKIAKKHSLKVIYDAAHTFGAQLKGHSLCSFGDLSILSFHATKVFNTFEGGAIVCHNQKMKHHIDNLKNFGFRGETVVEEPGINAKMNEVQAAMGLLQLKHVDCVIDRRKWVTTEYRKRLKNIKGITFLEEIKDVNHCYSYFPILVDSHKYGITRDELYQKLMNKNIFSRRYFFPLISQFPSYKHLESAQAENLPIAEKVANEVLCLPIYSEMKVGELERIVEILVK